MSNLSCCSLQTLQTYQVYLQHKFLSGLAGSHGMFIYNFFWILPSFVHRSCTKQGMKVLFHIKYLPPSQVKNGICLVSICISLMRNQFGLSLTCFRAIYLCFSFGEFSVNAFCPFFSWVVGIFTIYLHKLLMF